ncbi:hypothetical protein BH11PSE9_BH11PSE9_30510 [soil metagenome]
MPIVPVSEFIVAFNASPLTGWGDIEPWELTSRSSELVRHLLTELSEDEYAIDDDVAVHRSATVETGSILKGPLILSAGCFVAAGAYLRGGNWLAEDCIIGPGAELKSSFVFAGTKLAHFNFVGDSILGQGVNLEAGSIICNYRNERADKDVLVRLGTRLHRTGITKFGAVVGDNARLGANAVVAPGALLRPGTVLCRTELCDQEISVNPHGGD